MGLRKQFLILLLSVAWLCSPGQTPMHMLVAKHASGSGCIATDADACAFLAATGITDPTTADALDDLVIAAKAHGWWSKCIAIYPFVGGTATTHKYNLKDPRDLDAAFRLTVTGSYTHNANGITGDGGSAYGDTHIVGSTSLTGNDFHASIWSATNSAADVGDFGAVNASVTQGLLLYAKLSSGNAVARNPDIASDVTVAVANSTGYYDMTRTGSSSLELYKNGSVIGSNATSSGSFSAFNIYISAVNYTGGPIQYSARNYKFFTIGTSTNSTVAGDMYNDIAAFQTALGR
jgi:hypothetical protein